MRLFLVTYLRAQKLSQKVTTKKSQLEAMWLKYNFCRYLLQDTNIHQQKSQWPWPCLVISVNQDSEKHMKGQLEFCGIDRHREAPPKYGYKCFKTLVEVIRDTV